MRLETDIRAIEIDDAFSQRDEEKTLSVWLSASEIDEEIFLFLDRDSVTKIRDHLTRVLDEDRLTNKAGTS